MSPRFAPLLLLSLLLLPRATLSLDNGLGRTPQMGWNSWNHYGCGVNQSVIQATADAMVSSGLAKLGYRYVNVDDCWAKSRSDIGVIQADPSTFPDFRGMIDYVHKKGLLFGLYSDSGNLTCAGRPGSLGHEAVDAYTYAVWGVDYLKFDNCHNDGISPKVRYPKMTEALNETGRPIFYSLCEWGSEDPATWAAPVGNSWRTTGDIKDNWGKMIFNALSNEPLWQYAAPGGWNDPDMLEVGNGGMSVTEYETHFSLWCIMKAPLLIGCDVTSIDQSTMDILGNTELIAVNQDPLGKQAHIVAGNATGSSVWAGPLSSNNIVVLLLNVGDSAVSITAEWKDIGLDDSAKMSVRDLWLHKDLGVMSGSVTAEVQAHGVEVFRLSPQ